ncbi:hypothetical protein COY52_03230 [Candidatus Desantisbacteria bacterium CG_4_10_14_0_8_um_filter_48_22]|uniref:Uncharacterized protein n=1 Tax=Candidatus Desantisbacteria bacterium CG_4_10_14_0_8_um_filter_48_22 TaxID=1974543 RepID=A0A2M7SEG9_9BACT|nr:MAG: hypothetical protein AUJ67_06175 [Candidatus Desantisbacteria bacterium CG1_02_49_89]PIV54367.1 MAG: hypothetical protein COS16_10640 [Candidatus Desantisbacteria bacterium CG02_land_8_20_14_3_00_49_13]PIZ17703.1 MAG: hypothetical protein COY52_03230 [Candidatus Desantisbacteria bacterium CG_4_10_14_0_8_um_filter_48_22]
MSKNREIQVKVSSFEKIFKETVGNKAYVKMTKEERKVIHEMSECQMKGGPIGSAVIKEPSTR